MMGEIEDPIMLSYAIWSASYASAKILEREEIISSFSYYEQLLFTSL